MNEPYNMVLVNGIAFSLLSLGLILYRYIYPKKNISPFLILILFSFLPLISLLRPGVYESGDFSINIYKSMSFYQNLTEGHIIPVWAGELNATYGYPLFLFTYPLPYYIIACFHMMHFSFITSLKLLIATAFVASGITMYYWAKTLTGKISGVVAALFYLYAPYHLVDTNFRISIGEIVSFSLLPLVLLSVQKCMLTKKRRWWYMTCASTFFFLLCNPAISLMSMLLFIPYVYLIWKTEKRSSLSCFISTIFAGCTGLLLAAYYWMPVILESSFTHEASYTQRIGYVQWYQLLFTPWRYGLLFQGPEGQLGFLIGYMQIFVLFLSFLCILQRKFSQTTKKYMLFFLFSAAIACFLMLPMSHFVWDHISLLRNFQFTSRLLLFVALFTAILAAFISKQLHTWAIYVLCALVIVQTILNWGNRRTIPQINDTFLHKELPLSTANGEGFQPASPIWTDVHNPWEKTIPAQHMQILSGKARIIELKRTDIQHIYLVNVEKSANIKENTLYFPNWTVFANGKLITISYKNKKYPGVMTFMLQKGTYQISIKLLPTSVQIISGYISTMTFLSVGLVFLLQLRYATYTTRTA